MKRQSIKQFHTEIAVQFGAQSKWIQHIQHQTQVDGKHHHTPHTASAACRCHLPARSSRFSTPRKTPSVTGASHSASPSVDQQAHQVQWQDASLDMVDLLIWTATGDHFPEIRCVDKNRMLQASRTISDSLQLAQCY